MNNITDLDFGILSEQLRSGDRRFLSKVMTAVEQVESFRERLAPSLFSATGHIRYAGIAGSYGVGKSTLVDELLVRARIKNMTVGVVAVDPESVLTGGALLGDRIRMNRHCQDKDIFIRSMSSSKESIIPEVILFSRLLELWGADLVLIETAGLGQTQVEIAAACSLVILALQPGTGDDIQLMKSGIMEIADLIAITKADLMDPENLKNALQTEIQSSAAKKDVPVHITGKNLPGGYESLFDNLLSTEMVSEDELKKKMTRWLIKWKLMEKLESELVREKESAWYDPTSDPFLNARNYINKLTKGK